MTKPLQDGSLECVVENKIAILAFGHPASNSFPSALLTKLTHAFDKISKNEHVQVVLLKSKGAGAFCAGASFKELIALKNREEATSFFMGFANVINAMRKCPKLIIGRVQGKAVGGGVGLIAACDYVFAQQEAAIKLSEISIGIGPFVIAPAVERKIGLAHFSALSLAASTWKSAVWAEEKGLYAKVVNTTEELDKEVRGFTEKLASYNPNALLKMKEILWEKTENWEELLSERAKISGELVLSEFTKKALQQFKK